MFRTLINTDEIVFVCSAGPYRATQVWKSIIAHLRHNVDVRPRRIKKTYELCFSGTQAVNVVLDHLLLEKDSFTNKRISRDTAVKVCEAISVLTGESVVILTISVFLTWSVVVKCVRAWDFRPRDP